MDPSFLLLLLLLLRDEVSPTIHFEVRFRVQSTASFEIRFRLLQKPHSEAGFRVSQTFQFRLEVGLPTIATKILVLDIIVKKAFHRG